MIPAKYPEEQEEICETEIDNSAEQGCEKYRGLGGNNTMDRVFLLSYAEAVSLLESRNCEPTEYAHGRGAALYTDFGTCKWWSRSPGAGTNQQEALCFAMLGIKDSRSVTTATIGVRPALWIWIDGAPE